MPLRSCCHFLANVRRAAQQHSLPRSKKKPSPPITEQGSPEPTSSTMASSSSALAANGKSSPANPLVALWQAYERSLAKAPYEANAISGGVVGIISDLLRQAFLSPPNPSANQKHPNPLVNLLARLDYSSLLRQWCIGFAILHPIAYQFFNRIMTEQWLAKRFPSIFGKDAVTGEPRTKSQIVQALVKMACEQFLFAPVVNTAFMTASALLESRAADGASAELVISTVRKVKDTFWETQKANMSFWAPVSLLNFYFTPEKLRLLVSRMASLVWMVWLIKKSKA